MNYAEARTKNYPIGTGITEAAVKTVIGVALQSHCHQRCAQNGKVASCLGFVG